jgi:tetratricopeptide (TPR) repeat protein
MLGGITTKTIYIMTHLPQQIAPLKSWDEFEDLCCALFQKEWQNPMVQKNGRPGQRQNGVDVFGVNNDDAGLWYGVQCKGKDANYGAKLTTAEIDAELAKANTFEPKLGHWIIATTAAEDGKLQEYARKLTVARKAWGLCPVTVYGWGDIDTLLRKHLDVTRRFYPSHFENIIPASKFHVPQAFHLSDYFSDPLNHLQTLREQLLAQGETAVLAKANVQGMGGVGKTQLALKYSHDFKESYAGVWWFSAETQGGLESDCLLFCEKQGIPVAKNESPGSAVRDWLAGQEKWLLVYDNAEDVKMVRSFLPHSGKHHVLLTSRNPQWAGMKSLPLGVWNEEQGMLFLRARLEGTHGNDGELRALSKALDGLPLALEQACAYILSRKVSVANYIAALAKHETAMLAREDAAGCARSVLATLSLAFDQLSAAAQELLKLCGWMAAEPIPAYLFTEQVDELPAALQAAVQDEIVWRDTLAELERYALCQVAPVVLTDHVGNPGEEVDCLSFHRLTQAAARVGGSGRETMLILDLAGEPQEPKTWPRCQALLPHVVYMDENYQEQWDVALHLGWLLNQLALYLQFGPALYQTASLFFQRALAIAEKAQGPEHPHTGTDMNNLAGLYEDMGDYDAALPLYKRALAIAENTQGPEHLVTGIRLNNLAALYYATGDYDEALPLYKRALAIAEKAQGPEHPQTGSRLNNLALLYKSTGVYDAALPLYKRALAIAEKTQGPEHPETGTSLNNLAELFRSMGYYDAALPLFKRALAIAEKAQGPEHPDTGSRLNNLAALYFATGDNDAALPLLQRTLAIVEKKLGPEHPNSIKFRANLAYLQAKMN